MTTELLTTATDRVGITVALHPGGVCRRARCSPARPPRQGTEDDLELLLDQCDNILGRAFCALGDGATSPITSSIQYFRDEYIAHFEHGGCPFDHAASTLFAPEKANA